MCARAMFHVLLYVPMLVPYAMCVHACPICYVCPSLSHVLYVPMPVPCATGAHAMSSVPRGADLGKEGRLQPQVS